MTHPFPGPFAGPLAGLPLRNRTDLQAAVRALCAPLAARTSPGGAWVRLGATGAHFDDVAAYLEGFARPLWGIVPLVAGGGDYDGWDRYRRGLAAGTDPEHPEFWGAVSGRDQRMVEMAAIGLALALVPEQVWDPLPEPARANLTRWLLEINRHEIVDNNWLYFRVLVNLGLARVGAEHDPVAMHAALDRLESFYLGDGWYSDGPTPQRDYYVPFAMHFYGLVYATLAADTDPARALRLVDRAATFAADFAHWFAADGAALPYGRSLTYRFAEGAFWGALAYAGVEALPWPVVNGLALRHLRRWAERPIWQPDGTLSIGYAYPNLILAEQYNSPGSPYWALKFFLPLALPEAHPFWQAEEAPLPELAPVHPLPHAGMVVCRDRGGRHVVALSGGQQAPWVRHGGEKYTKFAYSTAFGFSVPSGARTLDQHAADSMLALSDDGVHYRIREDSTGVAVEADLVYSRWQPWPGVEVDTWLLADPPWHLRIHRLRTDRPLHSAEGGFALDRTNLPPAGAEQGPGYAVARGPAGGSGLRELAPPQAGPREGRTVRADPNTNLLAARTVIPTLVSRHEPGEHWLACAVLADPDPGEFSSAWELARTRALPEWFGTGGAPVSGGAAAGVEP